MGGGYQFTVTAAPGLTRRATTMTTLLVRQSRIFLVCGVLGPHFFKSRYVRRNLCTESAVTLGALNPSYLRRISPSPSA